MITICPNCSRPFSVDEKDRNRSMKCTSCGDKFIVYKAEKCRCGKLKHPNHPCPQCGRDPGFAGLLKSMKNGNSSPIVPVQEEPKSVPKNSSAEPSLSPQERISIGELTTLVESNLRALWATGEAEARAIPPVMIWGAPGVGKSTAIRELTEKLGIGFIDVRLAQREPVDMRGLPVPDGDRVRWLVSGEWPRDSDSRGIIIFDELTAADKTLQVAAYEFILDRRLGDLYQVPKNWYIVAAGNRTEDRAVACSMSSALANRFLHVEIVPQVRDFLAYGEARGMHPAVLGFIRLRPKLLFCQQGENLQRGWPSPRSWERVSTMMRIADRTGDRKSLQYIVPGLVGAGAAAEFLAYCNELTMQQMNLDIRERLLDGGALDLPKESDRAYACCEAVILFISREKDAAAQLRMFDNFLANTLAWSSDYAAMALNGIVQGAARRKKKLLAAARLPQWIAAHHLEDAACLKD